MKKLMIAAAIVCAAVLSQGASIAWGFSSGAIASPAAAYDDGDGFLIDGLVSLYVLADDGKTWQTAFEGMTMNEDYTFGHTDPENPGLSDFITKTNGQQVKMILTTLDGEYSITAEGTTSELKVVGMGETTYIASLIDATEYARGDWQSVPEPTSGLLLLIGVAGLALKRKRA